MVSDTLIITYRAGMVGSWDNGVKVGVEAGGQLMSVGKALM